MKVIFIKDVPKAGKLGEIKDVSDGYARNFLLRKKLVLLATDSVIKGVAQKQKLKKEKKEKTHEEFHSLKEALVGRGIIIRKKTDEKGNLYAGITSREIIEALKTANYAVPDKLDKKMIEIKTQIKILGEHEVKICFENEEITLKVEVQKLD